MRPPRPTPLEIDLGAAASNICAVRRLVSPERKIFAVVKAEALGVLIFVHPQASGIASEAPGRFKGNGLLDNVTGNPLETTIALSPTIFEGTLDQFPGLKICAARAGGYLPSYAGRSDPQHVNGGHFSEP